MLAFLVRRLAMVPILFLVAALIIFSIPFLSGIDPARSLGRARMGQGEYTPSPETLERIVEEFGLDQPLPIQFVNWLGHFVRGDLGNSYVSGSPVGEILLRGFKITAMLVSISMVLAISLSIPLGVLSAVRPGNWLDNILVFLTQIGIAVPSYFLGPVLILLFSLRLGWLPSSGWRGPLFFIMPALTLGVSPIAYFTRVTRAAMIEVLNMDYIRAARAKGLTEAQAIWRHALRNALIPVVTLAAIWIAGLLTGSLIIEVIFAVPGIGRIMYSAIIANDIPLIQAGLIFFVSLSVGITTLTDMVYIVLNPALSLNQPLQ